MSDFPLVRPASTVAITGAVTQNSGAFDVPTGVFTWVIPDGQTLTTTPGQTTLLATSASGMSYSASPGLLPGQTLQAAGGNLSLVNDSTVPIVDGSVPGSPKDAISDRNVVIEVMDSPIAHIRNATQGIEYEYLPPGSWPRFNSQASNRWNWVIGQSAPGDVIEISPGAVHAVASDASIYTTEPGGLQVQRPFNIRNMAGRGRWRVWPVGTTPGVFSAGIAIMQPDTMYAGAGSSVTGTGSIRGNMTIEGFDVVDQFGSAACGVKFKGTREDSPLSAYHASMTLRNFRIGKTAGVSASGISGTGGEVFLIEDGHIFDTAGSNPGQEHNMYITGYTLTLRGLRLSRTRGHPTTPSASGNWGSTLDGHVAKVSALTGLIEGCVFDCAELGDQSHLVQMKAGGNWTLRGNLFIDSKYPMTARGMINMCREFGTANQAYVASGATTDGAAYSAGSTVIGLAAVGVRGISTSHRIQFAGDANTYTVAVGDEDVSNGGSITLKSPGLLVPMSAGAKAITVVQSPNFAPWAGSTGNSLTVERNVFVGPFPRAAIFMFDWTGATFYQALFPPSDPTALDVEKMSSMIVRDNIGMIQSSDPAVNINVLQPFPGVNNASWIRNDPTGGTYWDARGNTTIIYSGPPWTAFSDRELLIYTRAAGLVAANIDPGTGLPRVLTTKRFIWPHGTIDRTDAYQGLA